jgi:hypothetical protein
MMAKGEWPDLPRGAKFPPKIDSELVEFGFERKGLVGPAEPPRRAGKAKTSRSSAAMANRHISG